MVARLSICVENSKTRFIIIYTDEWPQSFTESIMVEDLCHSLVHGGSTVVGPRRNNRDVSTHL